MAAIIRVKNLYKFYKVGDEVVKALNGISFEINRGEFCAIVGTSGSGKSTLLNMLAGLERPTRGEIVIGKSHIEKLDEKDLVSFRRNHVGFIFQSFHLMGTMNALENIAFPLSFRGVAKDEREKRAAKILKLVGLETHANHMPNQMSGGQQQRVGIARALVVDPKIIFADEPTGNLDSHTSMDVMRILQRIVREQNKTLIMVTHDNQLASYADKIFHISDGKIIQVEDHKEENQRRYFEEKEAREKEEQERKDKEKEEREKKRQEERKADAAAKSEGKKKRAHKEEGKAQVNREKDSEKNGHKPQKTEKTNPLKSIFGRKKKADKGKEE